MDSMMIFLDIVIVLFFIWAGVLLILLNTIYKNAIFRNKIMGYIIMAIVFLVAAVFIKRHDFLNSNNLLTEILPYLILLFALVITFNSEESKNKLIHISKRIIIGFIILVSLLYSTSIILKSIYDVVFIIFILIWVLLMMLSFRK